MTTIYQLPMQVPAMVGVFPNQKFMVSGDSLATVTTAGYLNQVNLESNPIAATDIIQCLYSFNQQTQSGTYGVFTVSISNGVITLTQWVDAANVLLPVTSGDVAIFNGTSGQIKDSGGALSNTSDPYFVMSPGSLTIGDIAKFGDANGTLADSGIAASTLSLTATISGATINAAAINGMYVTPIQLIAAPGSGKLIIVENFSWNIIYGSAAFTAGGVVTLQYKNTTNAGGILISTGIAAASITGISANSVLTDSLIPVVATSANTVNQGIYLSNATQAFATGTGATSSLNIKYRIVSAT